MSNRLPDSVRRAIRTFVQAFVGTMLTLVIAGGTFMADLTTWATYLDAAGIAGAIALFALLQNAAEDSGAIPAPLKLPTPAPGVDDPLA